MTKILLVDDDKITGVYQKHLNESSVCRADWSNTAEDGLQKVKDDGYDSIFIDIKFAESQMQGFELIAELVRLKTASKIFILTAYRNLDLAARAFRDFGIPINNILDKPVRTEDILHCIRAHAIR